MGLSPWTRGVIPLTEALGAQALDQDAWSRGPGHTPALPDVSPRTRAVPISPLLLPLEMETPAESERGVTCPRSHTTDFCLQICLPKTWGRVEGAQALRNHDLEKAMLATSETFSSLIYKIRDGGVLGEGNEVCVMLSTWQPCSRMSICLEMFLGAAPPQTPGSSSSQGLMCCALLSSPRWQPVKAESR